MSRLSLAVLILLGATAFAPAPFPRSSRKGTVETGVAVTQISGVWKIIKLESSTKDGLTTVNTQLHEVRIENNRWSFVYREARRAPVVYDLSTDPSQKPAPINFMRIGQTQPYGQGLVVRQGNVMKVLYSFGASRPARLVPPPPGYVLLTLHREH